MATEPFNLPHAEVALVGTECEAGATNAVEHEYDLAQMLLQCLSAVNQHVVDERDRDLRLETRKQNVHIALEDRACRLHAHRQRCELIFAVREAHGGVFP